MNFQFNRDTLARAITSKAYPEPLRPRTLAIASKFCDQAWPADVTANPICANDTTSVFFADPKPRNSQVLASSTVALEQKTGLPVPHFKEILNERG